MNARNPLSKLDGARLGKYSLVLETRPRTFAEQMYFTLHLKNARGEISRESVFSGVYSRGVEYNKVFGWVDGGYAEVVNFAGGRIVLEKEELDLKLFEILAKLVPRGGEPYDCVRCLFPRRAESSGDRARIDVRVSAACDANWLYVI
ncbi:MAG: hypothetical protein AB1468_06055 [Candidatus Micrarchaeota archaeon]